MDAVLFVFILYFIFHAILTYKLPGLFISDVKKSTSSIESKKNREFVWDTNRTLPITKKENAISNVDFNSTSSTSDLISSFDKVYHVYSSESNNGLLSNDRLDHKTMTIKSMSDASLAIKNLSDQKSDKEESVDYYQLTKQPPPIAEDNSDIFELSSNKVESEGNKESSSNIYSEEKDYFDKEIFLYNSFETPEMNLKPSYKRSVVEEFEFSDENIFDLTNTEVENEKKPLLSEKDESENSFKMLSSSKTSSVSKSSEKSLDIKDKKIENVSEDEGPFPRNKTLNRDPPKARKLKPLIPSALKYKKKSERSKINLSQAKHEATPAQIKPKIFSLRDKRRNSLIIPIKALSQLDVGNPKNKILHHHTPAQSIISRKNAQPIGFIPEDFPLLDDRKQDSSEHKNTPKSIFEPSELKSHHFDQYLDVNSMVKNDNAFKIVDSVPYRDNSNDINTYESETEYPLPDTYFQSTKESPSLFQNEPTEIIRSSNWSSKSTDLEIMDKRNSWNRLEKSRVGKMKAITKLKSFSVHESQKKLIKSFLDDQSDDQKSQDFVDQVANFCLKPKGRKKLKFRDKSGFKSRIRGTIANKG